MLLGPATDGSQLAMASYVNAISQHHIQVDPYIYLFKATTLCLSQLVETTGLGRTYMHACYSRLLFGYSVVHTSDLVACDRPTLRILVELAGFAVSNAL